MFVRPRQEPAMPVEQREPEVNNKAVQKPQHAPSRQFAVPAENNARYVVAHPPSSVPRKMGHR